MEANIASVNFTKYIKRGPNRWQHCPVVRGKTGRVKQDLVLVDGRIEQHPEGYYSLDWREGGRRHRRALGKDASAAQLAWERHVATQRARAIGIAVAEDKCATSRGVEEACHHSLVLRQGDKVMNGVVEELRRDALVVKLDMDGLSQSVTIPVTRKGESNESK